MQWIGFFFEEYDSKYIANKTAIGLDKKLSHLMGCHLPKIAANILTTEMYLSLYIILTDDQVFMATEGLLDEYILNESGAIYGGNYHQIGAKPWNFGQVK